MSTALLDAALGYAARGWQVFPCVPGGKTPLTPHGCLDATIDLEQIRAWWQCWPDANVAIATGPGSDLIVVDVDVKPEEGINGFDSLEQLEAQGFKFPKTWTVRTPSGGMHLYYRYGECDIKNSTGKIAPGIDVRGAGGYVVAPPSVIV